MGDGSMGDGSMDDGSMGDWAGRRGRDGAQTDAVAVAHPCRACGAWSMPFLLGDVTMLLEDRGHMGT